MFNLGSILQQAFLWSGTSEGHDFWLDYRTKWTNISCNTELQVLIWKIYSVDNERADLFRDLIRAIEVNPSADRQWVVYYDRFGQLPSLELLRELS